MDPKLEDAMKTMVLVTNARVNRIIFAMSMVAAFFGAIAVCDFFT